MSYIQTFVVRKAASLAGVEYSSQDDANAVEMLHGMMTGPAPSIGLQHLYETGELRLLFPDVWRLVGFGGPGTGHKDLWDHTKRVVDQSPNRLIIRWAALFHDIGKIHSIRHDGSNKVSFHNHESVSAELFLKAARRTNVFNKDNSRDIEFMIRHLGQVEAYESDWTDSAVRRLLSKCGKHTFDIIDLAKSDITTKRPEKRERIINLMSELRLRSEQLLIDGEKPTLPKGLGTHLIQELGAKPDRSLSVLMNKLTVALQEGKIRQDSSFDEYVSYCLAESLIER